MRSQRWPVLRRLAWMAGIALCCAVGPARAQEAPPGAPAAEDPEQAALQRELREIQTLLDRGRYEKAQGDLDTLLGEFRDADEPVPAAVWRPLAAVREARGDYAGAVAAWTACAGQEPTGAAGAAVLRARADARLRMGDVEAAEADYRAALEASPNELAAVVGLAELEELRGDRTAAEAGFRAAIDRFNARPEGLDLKAPDVLIAAGRAAEGLGRTAGAADGAAVGDGQMFRQAQQAYERAQAIDERAFDAFLRAGRLFIDNHNEAQALSYFRDVLKFNRSHPDAQAGMAAAYEPNWGRQDVARLHAQRALDVNPGCTLALVVLARLEATAENYEAALARCDAALKVNPWAREARALRAACCYVLGRTEDYRREADRYAAQHVGDGGVPHAVAAVLEDQRRFAEAAAWEQQAIDIDPTFWAAWINRGMNLLRVGDEVAGKAALEEGFRHYKYDVHAYNMRKLLRKVDGFVTHETAHFHMRFDPSEEEVMGPYSAELLERAWAAQRTNYGGFEPAGPVLFEMFPDADDFAVRTLGLPGLGALGACFGKVVTIDSPKAMMRPGADGRPQPAFNWAATAWHEYAHVVTLQLSGGRVPRWFTEGLSEFEEVRCRPEWERPLDEKLYGLWKADRLTPILELNNDFMGGDIGFAYFYAGWICRFLDVTRGRPAIIDMLKAYGAGKRTPQVIPDVLGCTPAEFDQQFHAWMGEQWKAWRLPAWYGDEERAALKRDLAAHPDDPAVLVKLARAYWQGRNVADAEIQAGRAARLAPDNGEALFILSEIARAKRRTEVAARRVKLAFERGFDDYYVRLRLAELAEAEGDAAAVRTHLEAAQRYFPRARGDASPARRLAILYAQAGEADAARAMLAHAVQLVPEDLDGRERLLADAVQRADAAAILQYCEEINNIDPFRFDHHLTWSAALREAGRLLEAVREGTVAVKLGEQAEDAAIAAGQVDDNLAVATGRAWAVLGLAYVAQQALDGARDALDAATKRAPDADETKALTSALAASAPGDGEKRGD